MRYSLLTGCNNCQNLSSEATALLVTWFMKAAGDHSVSDNYICIDA
jgi:hypothetical protein